MNPNLRIFHIRDAIARIQKATEGVTHIDISKNDILLRAVIYDIMIIGEATKHAPGDLKTLYSDIRWNNIAGVRDKLAHDYFDIDADIVWNIVKIELPKLKDVVDDYIAKHPESRSE